VVHDLTSTPSLTIIPVGIHTQRVYAMMVRIHDVYQMHSIFIHGFPGLLECFYVQERLIEQLMPDVYISLVRRAPYSEECELKCSSW
jgi:hypothetical protein